MPDKRTHRGAHPEDAELFAPRYHAALRAAVADLSWLLSRAYATPSAVKVVGDRYGLSARQRTAVMRCACADAAMTSRLGREMPIEQLRDGDGGGGDGAGGGSGGGGAGAIGGAGGGSALLIDGYNVLTTVEVALGGGWVLAARDTTFRDMASMHGTFRKVEETAPAIELVGRTLAQLAVGRSVWYLDQPVSNSGRLKAVINEIIAANGWPWDVQIVPNPDAVLIASAATNAIVASADSVILDGCARWLNLARQVIERHVPRANIADLQVN